MRNAKDIDLTETAATEADSPATDSPTRPPTPGEVAASRYTLGDEVGRGGIGRVLSARDNNLDRDIAVKELLKPTVTAEARFLREAKITARLQHPGIVPIYETGRWPNGDPFYAMKRVSGATLKALVTGAGSLAERLALLPKVLAIADAISFAHSKSIVHRDLKPSNIVVGEFGETVLIDWGLARDLAESDESEPEDSPYRTQPQRALTRAGAVVGTPAYMSPEQANGQAVDERFDIYSLGAVLFHVIAGEAPYGGSDSDDVLESVRTSAPNRLLDRQPLAPQELVAIVDKAMARKAANRYRTAAEFRDDLRSFINGQRVDAHSYTLVELFHRWRCENAAYVRAGAIALAVIALVGFVSIRRVISEKDTAEREREIAQVERRQAEDARMEAQAEKDKLVLARAESLADSDPTAALAWLKRYRGDQNAKAFAIAERARAAGVATAEHRMQGEQIVELRTLRNGNVLTVSSDGRVELADFESGTTATLVRDVEPHFSVSEELVLLSRGKTLLSRSLVGDGETEIGRLSSKVTAVAATDRWFAAGSASGGVSLWMRDSKTPVSCGRHGESVFWVSAAPSGSYLVSTGGGEVRLCRNGGNSRAIGRSAPTSRVQVSRTERYIAWSAPNGDAVVHDVSAGSTRRLPSDSKLAGPFSFSEADRYIAFATAKPELRVFDLTVSAEALRQTLSGPSYAIQFSLTGSVLAVADPSQVRLVDLRSMRHATLLGHQDVWTVGFSTNSKELFTAGSRGTLRRWRPEGFRSLAEKHKGFVSQIASSSDGLSIASSGSDGSVVVLIGAAKRELPPTKAPLTGLAFGLANTVLVGASSDGSVYLWHLRESTNQVFEGHVMRINRLAFNQERTVVATASTDETIRVSNLQTGSSQRLQAHAAAIYALAFSTGGKLYSGDESGRIVVSDPGSGQSKTIVTKGPAVEELLALHTGSLIVVRDGYSSNQPSSVSVLSDESARFEELARHDESGIHIAASGTGFSTAGTDGKLFSFDLDLEPRVAREGLGRCTALEYSPTGNRLAHGNSLGVVRIYDLQTRKWTARRVLNEAIQELAFTGEDHIVVGGSEGTVQVMSTLPAWTVSPLRGDGLAPWLAEQTRVSPDHY